MKINGLDSELGGLILNSQKINKSELARKYGVDRHAISRHINALEKPPERKLRKCGLLKHYEIIKNKLEEVSSLKSIYMYLLNLSSIEEIGSYSNFKQYVIKHFSEVRINRKEAIAKYRYETPPGDLLQFDWVEKLSLHLKNGALIEFNLWSATLKYSRRHIFKVTKRITEADFRRCLIETFITLGGTTKRVLTDNMSAIVNVNNGKRTIHPTVIQFMKDIDVELDLCKVRHPYTKGAVEVSNKYQYWLKPYDFSFDNEADLYKGVEEIVNQCNYQENSETSVAPIILFKIEQRYLRELPNRKILEAYHSASIPIKVNNSALICYQGAKYGVPKEYINTTILIAEIDDEIHLFNKQLKTIQIYKKETYGIHYAKGLYAIAARKGESKEEYDKRVTKNLEQLSQAGSFKRGETLNNG